MANKENTAILLREENLLNLIYHLRTVEVMLDNDLAELYRVETKVFNQAVKRNIVRFPGSFRFQLTQDEYDSLRSRIVTLNADAALRSPIAPLETGRGKHRKYLPFAFTEQGVAMLSAVLRSETAIQTSIHIISAFVGMRRLLAANGGLLLRMETLEKRQFTHEIKTDASFDKVFDALESKSLNPAQNPNPSPPIPARCLCLVTPILPAFANRPRLRRSRRMVLSSPPVGMSEPPRSRMTALPSRTK